VVFVREPPFSVFDKARKVIFSVPLHTIQSVTYQTKVWDRAHGFGISYSTAQSVQTATFVFPIRGSSKESQIQSAESQVAQLGSSVKLVREIRDDRLMKSTARDPSGLGDRLRNRKNPVTDIARVRFFQDRAWICKVDASRLTGQVATLGTSYTH
jgi:hypothetical protein